MLFRRTIFRTVSSFTAAADFIFSRFTRGARVGLVASFGLGLVLGACTCEEDKPAPVPFPTHVADESHTPREVIDSEQTASAEPKLLYVPDAAVELPSAAPTETLPIGPVTRCPADMVDVRGQFCIDRYEDTLVDIAQARAVSPYYAPTFFQTQSAYKTWDKLRHDFGTPEVQLLPLPEPPSFQLQGNFDIRAVSKRGVTPNGYLSGILAERACHNAHKRLCTELEWVTACRGEADQQFPYGPDYQSGKCNVFNGAHPALLLHGNASEGHLDPRLNYFEHHGAPLLHVTGASPECKSRWGNDAVYDMVGNLDEWIADEGGVFLGGFYARNTREGCASRISAHPRGYFDYSLGVRCCD